MMVIDYRQLYAGGESTPDDMAKLNSSMIYFAHFCDDIAYKEGTAWNEVELRDFLPGDGEIPIQERWTQCARRGLMESDHVNF